MSEKKNHPVEPPQGVSFEEAYSSSHFQELMNKVTEVFGNYLASVTDPSSRMAVMPETNPDSLLSRWSPVPQSGPFLDDFKGFEGMLKKLLNESNHLHHPKYVGHQDSSSLPLAAIGDMISAFLNNGMVVFEMGQANTIIEKLIVDWLIGEVGYSSSAGGFLTSGGSLGNLTALIAARQIKAGWDVWNQGLEGGDDKLAIIASHYSHYCVRRSSQIMGMGSVGAVITAMEDNNDFHVSKKSLEEAYKRATNEGRKVICVVGSACNTSPGTFENLNMMADFAEKHNLWFHVDAAHGGPTILSEKYRSLVAGIERADSIVYDLHKMMMMPSIATAVLFKRNSDSYQAMKQDAPYLYNPHYREEDDWYNIGKRTMECTKFSMGFKLYLSLAYYGKEFFANYVTRTYDLAREFAEKVRVTKGLELALEPESNIVCFRYLGEKGSKKDDEKLSSLQAVIRQKIIESGKFYIVQTRLAGRLFLRVSIMNPLTSIGDLEELLDLVIKTGKGLEKEIYGS